MSIVFTNNVRIPAIIKTNKNTLSAFVEQREPHISDTGIIDTANPTNCNFVRELNNMSKIELTADVRMLKEKVSIFGVDTTERPKRYWTNHVCE